jgi:hypothetical protein
VVGVTLFAWLKYLGTPEFRRLAARGQVVGAILGVIVAVILFLMVAKPNP